MQIIQNYWNSLSATTRSHIISAVRTFGATFVGTFLIILKSGQVSWSWPFWFATTTAAFNAGFKALIESYAPVSLGGLPK
jgi:hypothetical protein